MELLYAENDRGLLPLFAKGLDILQEEYSYGGSPNLHYFLVSTFNDSLNSTIYK